MFETMPARRKARRCWICGCGSLVAADCPSRHDIVGRRQDEVWDSDVIQNVERVEQQEKGIGSTLNEVEMMNTSKGEGILLVSIPKPVMLQFQLLMNLA